MKHLMSGNEATARGVYEAGIKVCSAYPGTPSTEILENLPQYGKDVYCEWAPNEKVATEVAYGASVAGSRSFCTMKMVGLNAVSYTHLIPSAPIECFDMGIPLVML